MPERIGARVVTGADHDAIIATAPELRHAARTSSCARRRAFRTGRASRWCGAAGVATTTGVAAHRRATARLPDARRLRRELQLHAREERRRLQPGRRDAGRVLGAGAARAAPKASRSSPPTARRGRAPRATPTPIWSSAVTFPGPFPENATFRVELPAGLDRRDRARPRERRPLPADRHHRRLPAARQVQRPLRHRRVEGRRDAAGDAPQSRARGARPRPRARRHGHRDGQRPAAHARARGRHPALAPARRRRQARDLGLRAAAEARRRARPRRPRPPPAAIKTFTLPKPGGERAFEVVGIPLDEPGLYIVELESSPPRRRAARQAAADVRPDGGAGHQSLGALQVGRRAIARLGDHPRRGAPGRRARR